MCSLPILQIVENPEIAKPNEDATFVRITFVQPGKHRFWKLRFATNFFGEVYAPGEGLSFGEDLALLGGLHHWSHSKSSFPKYIFMTSEAAEILIPAMSVPVVECVMTETMAVS